MLTSEIELQIIKEVLKYSVDELDLGLSEEQIQKEVDRVAQPTSGATFEQQFESICNHLVDLGLLDKTPSKEELKWILEDVLEC